MESRRRTLRYSTFAPRLTGQHSYKAGQGDRRMGGPWYSWCSIFRPRPRVDHLLHCVVMKVADVVIEPVWALAGIARRAITLPTMATPTIAPIAPDARTPGPLRLKDIV